MDFFATRGEGEPDASSGALTFEGLFGRTEFLPRIEGMLHALHAAYDYPVDVEFTANIWGGDCKINIVQCRPLQVKEAGTNPELPELDESQILLDARGAVVGQGRLARVDRVIYVRPEAYSRLSQSDRYTLVKKLRDILARDGRSSSSPTQMLLGPGRWGTTTPSLGVPARFSDIEKASVLVEVVSMGEAPAPDVSLGTHFFNEIVESDILYFALFPDREDNRLNVTLLDSLPNRVGEYLPDADSWKDVIAVWEPADGRSGWLVHADPLQQRVVAYEEEGA
jgi:hypothetical protein